MNCGPASVAHLVRRPFHEVLGRFEWVIEQQTRNKRRRNGSGTTFEECKRVLEWYGFTITEHERNRRTTLKKWARTHRTGRWLMLQPNHWFSLRGGTQIRREKRRVPSAPIVGWSRIERKTT